MNSSRSPWKKRIVLIVMLSAAVFLVAAASKMTYRQFRLRGELTQVEQEIVELKAERAELNRSLDAFGELATIEKAAREVLNLQREGESVVILLPSGEDVLENQVEIEAVDEDAGEPKNIIKWWAYFFGEGGEG